MTSKTFSALGTVLLILLSSYGGPNPAGESSFASHAWPSRAQEIARAAEALRPQLIELRRDLHMHPELSNREERTSRVVAERLRALSQIGRAHV